VRERRGLFEEADCGSLFLDEIGELRPSLQAKLTRVLEERVVRRVGEAKERPVDVRLITATHRDLAAMVKEGTFREDLWYRLNVALVEVPPLRKRREDIGLLAHFFLREHAARSPHLARTRISQAALAALTAFDWPGNVRQLRSAVERASVVASGDEIRVVDLPPELQTTDAVEGPEDWSQMTWAEAMDRGRQQLGRRYLEAVLMRAGGRVSEAARHAGVERESFYRLLRKHGIDRDSNRPSPDGESGA
jgi:two-component system response regulator HydG